MALRKEYHPEIISNNIRVAAMIYVGNPGINQLSVYNHGNKED